MPGAGGALTEAAHRSTALGPEEALSTTGGRSAAAFPVSRAGPSRARKAGGEFRKLKREKLPDSWNHYRVK
jgi:hypothetical protein